MKWMHSKLSSWISLLFAKTVTIKAVILDDGDLWAVQCLDYDIAAQGETVHEAIHAFMRTVTAQIYLDVEKGRAPFANIDPAPQEFWEMFDQGVLVTDDFHEDPPNILRKFRSTQELRLCA